MHFIYRKSNHLTVRHASLEMQCRLVHFPTAERVIDQSCTWKQSRIFSFPTAEHVTYPVLGNTESAFLQQNVTNPVLGNTSKKFYFPTAEHTGPALENCRQQDIVMIV